MNKQIRGRSINRRKGKSINQTFLSDLLLSLVYKITAFKITELYKQLVKNTKLPSDEIFLKMYIRNGGLVLEQRSIYGAYYIGSLRNSALTIDLYKSKTLKIV